jgi:hypothetical protein
MMTIPQKTEGGASRPCLPLEPAAAFTIREARAFVTSFQALARTDSGDSRPHSRQAQATVNTEFNSTVVGTIVPFA